MLKKSLFWGMTVVLLTASFGLMGCEQESPKSGDKSIIAFSINAVEGIIDEDAKLIAVTLPSGNDLSKLTPVVVISSSSHIINPETGEVIELEYDAARTRPDARKLPEADFTNGKSYVVKAEDGSKQTYGVEVTVRPAVVLQSLSVTVSKTTYAYNEAFDNGSLFVTGTYSDGSKKQETVGTAEGNAVISGYDAAVVGTQNLTVTIGDVFATFQVTVELEGTVEVSIALPNTATQPVVYGIPTDGIILSRFGLTDKPKTALISVDGTNLWTTVKWYIDGVLYQDSSDESNRNIIEIDADGWDNSGTSVVYTLNQPHTITFTGTKGEVEYSKNITFKVVK